MEEKTIQSTNIDQLKDSIYDIIKKHFGANELEHQVGRDFSEDDLDRCLNYYYDYICK